MEDKKYSKLKAAFEATQPQVPTDFTKRVMKRIEESTPNPIPSEGPTPTLPKGGRNKSFPNWGRLVAAAACLLIIIGVGLKLLPKEEPAKTQQIVVKKTEQQGSKPKAIEKEPIQMAKEEKAVVAKTTMINKRSKASVSESKTSTTVATTDSLDYYIDKIERELAQVDESLYIERMNKVIRADERLQRMVNSYILHTLDKEGRPQTADNMYNVKIEEDEE